MHATEVPARAKLLKLPAPHAVQPEVPVERAAYVPVAQPAHAVDEVAWEPALYVPAGHAVQPDEAADRSLNAPAAHATHAAPTT